MQFADRIFCDNNILALSFRKVLSSKYDNGAELSEDLCAGVLDKDFVDIFALSV